jgi:hypothetical protein
MKPHECHDSHMYFSICCRYQLVASHSIIVRDYMDQVPTPHGPPRKANV